MQILRQFGELSPDLIDMQRYAAWKAADIRKALREGRTPTAGAPASAESAEQDLLDELGLPSVPGELFIVRRQWAVQWGCIETV